MHRPSVAEAWVEWRGINHFAGLPLSCDFCLRQPARCQTLRSFPRHLAQLSPTSPLPAQPPADSAAARCASAESPSAVPPWLLLHLPLPAKSPPKSAVTPHTPTPSWRLSPPSEFPHRSRSARGSAHLPPVRPLPGGTALHRVADRVPSRPTDAMTTAHATATASAIWSFVPGCLHHPSLRRRSRSRLLPRPSTRNCSTCAPEAPTFRPPGYARYKPRSRTRAARNTSAWHGRL